MTARMLGSTRTSTPYNPVTTRPCDDDGLPRLRSARPVRITKRRETRTWQREQV